MGGVIVCLILASFIKEPSNQILNNIYNLRNGLICVSLLIIGLVVNLIKTKKTTLTKQVFKELQGGTNQYKNIDFTRYLK